VSDLGSRCQLQTGPAVTSTLEWKSILHVVGTFRSGAAPGRARRDARPETCSHRFALGGLSQTTASVDKEGGREGERESEGERERARGRE